MLLHLASQLIFPYGFVLAFVALGAIQGISSEVLSQGSFYVFAFALQYRCISESILYCYNAMSPFMRLHLG